MNVADYSQRYTSGEWRTAIFFDLIKNDLEVVRPRPHLLDIGCGSGFDEDFKFQLKLAQLGGRMVGVEPASEVPVGQHFDEVHRCLFEDAPIEPNSIDLAWAVMVLEHINDPTAFFDKLHTVLREGGVFWGFTVDSRHYFAKLSALMRKLRLENFYLKYLHAHLADPEYRHYPAFYRCNCPADVERSAASFRDMRFLNFNKPGQVNSYLPKALRPVFTMYDRWLIRRGKPGALFAIRIAR